MAGADAVQVGTATFRDPRAPWKVLRQLARWCDDHGATVGEMRASARRRACGGDAAAVSGDATPGTGSATPDPVATPVPLRNEGGRDD